MSFKIGDKVYYTREGVSLRLKRDELYTIKDIHKYADGIFDLSVEEGYWYQSDLFTLAEIHDSPLQKALDEV